MRREGYQQPWLPVPTYLVAKLTSAFSYVRSEQNGTVTCGSEKSIKIASYGRHPFLFLRIPLVFGVEIKLPPKRIQSKKLEDHYLFFNFHFDNRYQQDISTSFVLKSWRRFSLVKGESL